MNFEEQCYVKHQSIFMVINSTSNTKWKFKNGTLPFFSDFPASSATSVVLLLLVQWDTIIQQ